MASRSKLEFGDVEMAMNPMMGKLQAPAPSGACLYSGYVILSAPDGAGFAESPIAVGRGTAPDGSTIFTADPPPPPPGVAVQTVVVRFLSA